MKRTKSLTVMITVFALFSLTGCGNSQQGSNESRDNNPSSLSDLSSKVDTESGTVSYDQQEQEEAALNNNSDAQEIVYKVTDEIKNADFSSGLVQIGDDIFRNGGYITVDQFLQEYGDKYNVTEYMAGMNLTIDPDGYMRTNMTQRFEVNSKEDPSVSFSIKCDANNVDTDEEKVRIGDSAIVSFETVSDNCWYPHGICRNAEGFTISDIPNFLTELGYKKINAEDYANTYGGFTEWVGLMDVADIAFNEKGTDENLFGETPIYSYSFSYILNQSTPIDFEVSNYWRSGCDTLVDLNAYHPAS